MSNSYSFAFTLDIPTILEGMALSQKHTIKPRKWTVALFTYGSIIIYTVGGIAMFFGAGVFLTGAAELPIYYMWIGGVLGILFYIASHQWTHRFMAERSLLSGFSQGTQEVVFDPSAMTYRNAQAEWRTGWGGIDALHLGKLGLTMQVGGVALIVPLQAMDDPAGVIAQIRKWKAAA